MTFWTRAKGVAVCVVAASAVAGVFLILAGAGQAAAQTAAPKGVETALGSAEFHPSPERPVGWRGDGTGRFPGANPPLHWGRVANSVKELRAQATKPKEGQTGKPIPDGVVREWLVLGPVAAPDAQALLKAQGDAKIDLSPDENDKAGNVAWKKVSADSSVLDIRAAIGDGKEKGDVALAHAYLYSETKATVRIVWRSSGAGAKVLVNGVLAKVDCDLEKGWNRLLFQVSCPEAPVGGEAARWNMACVIYGAPGSEYASENIVWTTRLPGWGIAAPVIAGDRIFVPGEMRTLCCVDKNSGRILWAQTATLCDVSTEDERKAHPEVFKEIEPMLKRLAELDQLFAGAGPLDPKLIAEKVALERKIDKLMYGVDKTRYDVRTNVGDAGNSPRTPVTDGRRVYVSYQPCLTVCYDLEGNRKWVHSHDLSLCQHYEHGAPGSPCLIAGKLIIHTNRVIALDAETGQVAWESPVELSHFNPGLTPAESEYTTGKGYGYWSSLSGLKVGGEDLLVTPVDVVRVRDGRRLAYLGPGFRWPGIPTPVLHENTMYRLHSAIAGRNDVANLDIIRLPDKVLEPYKPEARTLIGYVSAFPGGGESWFLASPLYHDGLVYLVTADGALSVVDVEKDEVVYQRVLDVDIGPGGLEGGILAASPALGGNYIYIFGNLGTCLIIEPGRRYKPVAKNRIEQFCTGSELAVQWETLYQTGLERTISCPIFQGRRMYYRGILNLYCIEEKDTGEGQ